MTHRIITQPVAQVRGCKGGTAEHDEPGEGALDEGHETVERETNQDQPAPEGRMQNPGGSSGTGSQRHGGREMMLKPDSRGDDPGPSREPEGTNRDDRRQEVDATAFTCRHEGQRQGHQEDASCAEQPSWKGPACSLGPVHSSSACAGHAVIVIPAMVTRRAMRCTAIKITR